MISLRFEHCTFRLCVLLYHRIWKKGKFFVKKSRFRLWLVLTVLWIALIFLQSLMPAKMSDAESGGILTVIRRLFPWMTNHLLRKLGHFAEYAVAGFLLTRTCLLRKRFTLYQPLLLGLLTALCDETIQLFVEGRSGQISDVWLDAAGIATGALLIWIFRRK